MPARAFIIAIEDYKKGNFLESLTGVNEGAAVFVRWLVERKGVKPADIVCCAGKKFSAGPVFKKPTAGTTRPEIVAELARVLKDWANKTEEFYFYFSGHGFSYADSPWEKAVDILAASDFKDLETGGAACLRLSEIQSKLRHSLGPRHHYFFIDACRNQIPSESIAPATTGLGFPVSDLGNPSVYKLFSTAPGALSHTTSGFTSALVESLSGRGRAKGLRARKMYVIFDLLCEHMKKKVEGQEIDFEREGSGEGYILELNPIPKSTCVVKVAGAKPTDEFTLTFTDFKDLTLERKFKGDSYKLDIFPDDYSIRITHPTAKVIQKEPPPADYLDLYDPRELKFEMRPRTVARRSPGPQVGKTGDSILFGKYRGSETKSGGDEELLILSEDDILGIIEGAGKAGEGRRGSGGELRGGAPPPAPQPSAPPTDQGPPKPARLRVKGTSALHTGIEVRSISTGAVIRGVDSLDALVPPGDYEAKLRERGVTVERRRLTLKAGQTQDVDLMARPVSKVHEQIVKAVKGSKVAGATIYLERYLGPMVNRELKLWLSIIGASRIVSAPSQHVNLSALPLESFEDMREGETAAYVLAGFEKTGGEFSVGLSEGAEVAWEPLRAVEGLESIYERRLRPGRTGARLMSLKMPGRPALTFATYCLPNRVTFFALAEDEDGRLNVHQFLLPVHHLINYFAPETRPHVGRNVLGVVRTMCLAQGQFARKRSVEEHLKTTDKSVWNNLVERKWLDPLMPLLVAYDIIRHGTAGQMKIMLEMLSGDLRRHFEGIPDVEAIAKLIGAQWSAPSAAPLLLDGVLAFDDMGEKQTLPLLPERLDYAGLWTSWRGAVS